jgi:alpha-glucosidase
MIAPQSVFAPHTKLLNGSDIGNKTSIGSETINKHTGVLKMTDVSGKVITTMGNPLANADDETATNLTVGKETCTNAQNNMDIDGASTRSPNNPDGLLFNTQHECCEACDEDPQCTAWVYVTSGAPQSGKNCWPMKFVAMTKSASDRTFGGITAPTPAPTPAPGRLSLSFSSSSSTKLYGGGSGKGQSSTLSRTSVSPHVQNTEVYVPYYYSTDGYSALGVTPIVDAPGQPGVNPASYSLSSGKINWSILTHPDKRADIYLMPAESLKRGTAAYYELTGKVPVNPRYTFGFMACRWGWKDDKYIWETLSEFRAGAFPIDAWISDFEWFTSTPDYTLQDPGRPDYHDFGYNNVTFPNPAQQLSDYKTKLNLRFGGIRKPRLGNSNLLVMARSKDWTISGHDGGSRNLNYSIPELDTWYGQQEIPYLKDGVEFFWNDEGETTWYTFHYWNYAETLTLKAFKANKRFFTINRAFTPGMQRFGATTWTGDIQPSWQDLVTTSGVMLNWGLAGNPVVTCDTGGFSGETNSLLLSRWYQVAAFMPVMRVHSTLDAKPHFPFPSLWGDDASASMKKSLELRYRMIPYHYSFAHDMYNTGIPAVRALLMEFPDDSAVAEMTTEWMFGESVLVAPVLSEDNSTKPYLPAGTWYEFDNAAAGNEHMGPTTLELSNVPLDHIPVYVKAGGIIALSDLVQFTDALPGPASKLELQVYGGADGTFTLYEDDGETVGYQAGTASVRATTFTWKESSKTLSWKSTGSYSTKLYALLEAKLFTSGSSASKTASLSKAGSVIFN